MLFFHYEKYINNRALTLSLKKKISWDLFCKCEIFAFVEKQGSSSSKRVYPLASKEKPCPFRRFANRSQVQGASGHCIYIGWCWWQHTWSSAWCKILLNPFLVNCSLAKLGPGCVLQSSNFCFNQRSDDPNSK